MAESMIQSRANTPFLLRNKDSCVLAAAQNFLTSGSLASGYFGKSVHCCCARGSASMAAFRFCHCAENWDSVRSSSRILSRIASFSSVSMNPCVTSSLEACWWLMNSGSTM